MEYERTQDIFSCTSKTLSDHMHEMEVYSTMNLYYMAEIKRLSKLCGTEEMDKYIENSMCNMEKNILWIKAARSFLENV